MNFSKKHVKETYDGRAARFSDIGQTFKCEEGIDDRLQRRVHEHLRSLSRRGYVRLVDFGCGPGKLLAHAMEWALADGLFIGVDKSIEMLQQAEARLTPAAQKKSGIAWKLVGADVSRTPLPSDSADLVNSKMLFHHVVEPSAVMREMARVVRPGGTVLVMVPGPGYQQFCRIPGKHWQSTGFPPKNADESGNRDRLGRFSGAELKELAWAAGLWPVTCYADNFVYHFATFGAYLHFMDLTGADAKLRNYLGSHLSLFTSYHGIAVQTDAIEIAGEFVTLEARKPDNDQ